MNASLQRVLRSALGRRGYQVSRTAETMVIRRPQPGLPTSACVGIDWNAAGVDAFLAGPLTDYRDEYNALPQQATAASAAYHTDNPFFGLADAAVAYSWVRSRRPTIVAEVGSGNSSLLLRAALTRNATGRLVCIDPHPRVPVGAVADAYLSRLVQAVTLDWFQALPPDAILFIDSSHLAGTGSDVNYLLLDVLPALAPGVLVHVHDVYLPDDYPVSWNIERNFNYSEQYLLQALLCFSSGFRVRWPGRWALQNRAAALAAVLRPGTDLQRHCSFWLERVASGEDA